MIPISSNISEFFTHPERVVEALAFVARERPEVGTLHERLAETVAQAVEMGFLARGFRDLEDQGISVSYYKITAPGRALLRVVLEERMRVLVVGD